VLEILESLTHRSIGVIHIVGGGSQNRLLNQLVAEVTGRVVRAWLQLTDDPGSAMILRTAKEDRDHEVRIPLHRGAQFVVDSERMWHGVHHPGTAPRYALIVSFESDDALQRWMDANRDDAERPLASLDRS
jgi:hypothetical protein